MKHTKENKKLVADVGLLVHTKENKTVEETGFLVDPELILICRHCGKQIDQSLLIGLSLKCPSCGMPQNGHPQDPTLDPYDDMTVICKHCGSPINQARLRGISLICPICGMPQNGLPHPVI